MDPDAPKKQRNESRVERGAERAGNFFYNLKNIIIGVTVLGGAYVGGQQFLFPEEGSGTYFYLAGICDGTSRTPDVRWQHQMFAAEQIRIRGKDAPTDPAALRKAMRKRLKGDLIIWPASAGAATPGRKRPNLEAKQQVLVKPGSCVRVDGIKAGRKASSFPGCPAGATRYWATGTAEAC